MAVLDHLTTVSEEENLEGVAGEEPLPELVARPKSAANPPKYHQPVLRAPEASKRGGRRGDPSDPHHSAKASVCVR